MAHQIEWTELAWRDLEKAAEYIAMDSEHYAAAFIAEIEVAAN